MEICHPAHLHAQKLAETSTIGRGCGDYKRVRMINMTNPGQLQNRTPGPCRLMAASERASSRVISIVAHRMMDVMAGYMATYGRRLTDSSHQFQAFGAPRGLHRASASNHVGLTRLGQ